MLREKESNFKLVLENKKGKSYLYSILKISIWMFREELCKRRRNIGQNNQNGELNQMNNVTGSSVPNDIDFENYSIEDALNY